MFLEEVAALRATISKVSAQRSAEFYAVLSEEAELSSTKNPYL